MITVTRLASPSEKKRIFDAFDGGRQTWLVPDAASKKQLQQNLLRKNGFIEDECVMRMGDFWCALLKRVRPDFEVISNDLARVVVAQYLQSRDFAWARTPGAAQMACRYIKYLMPVLSHPNGKEAILAWFAENPDAYNRWGHWFLESYYLWARFNESRMVALDWVPGFLVNETGFSDVWSRELVVDAGPCLLSVEAELFSVLGRHFDIQVIEPTPGWQPEFQKNFAPYKFLESLEDTPVKDAGEGRSPGSQKIKFMKMTTMLAEVKQATASIRQWLDRGVMPSEISIIAPDLGPYWPALRAYLREEGVPVRREHTTSLSAFPEVFQWISRLRIALGDVTRGTLETALFSGGKDRPLAFDRFKILFGVIYGEDDLARSEDVYNMFKGSAIKPDELFTRDRFLAWALGLWGETDSTERLELLMQNFLRSGPASLKLPARAWLEHLIATTVNDGSAVRLEGEDTEGVRALELSASEHIFSTHTVLMGLTEKALRREEQVSILPKDLQSLHQSLGFSLPVLEDSRAEFAARWLFEDPEREFVVTVPLSDFSGEVETPSLLWLTGAAASGRDPHKVDVPELTRWDELQAAEQSAIPKARGWSEERAARVLDSIAQDRGEKEWFAYGGELIRSLSASAFEDYLNCPFVFASKRLFKLSDLPSVDLDIDHMTKGKLVHALFEELTREPMHFHWSDEQLLEVIERCRTKEKVVLGDEKLWGSMRKRYLTIAKRFLEFERAWRQQFTRTKTVGRELEVKGVITPEAELLREGEGPGILFRGSIDRVDSDGEERAVIIDYKSTKGDSVTHHNKWLEKNILQLLLYAMAMEKGLSVLGPQEVIGALYFVVRDLTREHGFMLQEYDGILFQSNNRKGHGMSSDEKRELFEAARARLKDVLGEITRGRMHPHPFDAGECRVCQWRTLCRAPHLL
ncbi:MAG TPA: PD-(D/E)XK nuclease family protein [Bdellovibrionales bacterium]|nr:PD-(D/E)XK nuclease family protein [Bdellovibrionales bacterium]